MAETAFKPAPSLTQAPALTLPEDAAEAVRSTYAAARVILEYGSGGSTAVAAAMPGKTVFSVESDAGWAQGLRDWFAANPPAADRLVIHHADIGPTGKWGRPVNDDGWEKYHLYPLGIWDSAGFEHPDAVLVDGRFRVACFLTTLFRITRPVTLLWDDYSVRPAYHKVERLARPVRMHGRMAEFRLEPAALPRDQLTWIIGQFGRVH